jgi:hypothetical protein
MRRMITTPQPVEAPQCGPDAVSRNRVTDPAVGTTFQVRWTARVTRVPMRPVQAVCASWLSPNDRGHAPGESDTSIGASRWAGVRCELIGPGVAACQDHQGLKRYLRVFCRNRVTMPAARDTLRSPGSRSARIH